MSVPAVPFDDSRPRPVTTVLDLLRKRIDPDDFDVAIFTLEAVAADLGFGDVRALPGSVAWIDRLRGQGKRIALVALADRASEALALAGIADRFDHLATGVATADGVAAVLEALGIPGRRALFAGTDPDALRGARAAGAGLAVGLVRGPAGAEELRKAGAGAVLADLQELLRDT